MCGFTGYIDTQNSSNSEKMHSILSAMGDTIAYRGPDDKGTWADPKTGVALAHRRLSIIDLSSAGHQPMISASKRYVIIYNGEIYNFSILRKKLEQEGHTFRGHSDTEVVLAGFEAWGIEKALKQFVGMFAFALWDCHNRQLVLARDRMGEKPLYYGWMNNTFLFGSELKALRAHPAWCGTIDRDALALQMRHGFIPSPLSIYKNIFKLPPATYLSLPWEKIAQKETPDVLPFWSLHQAAESGIENPFQGSEEDAITQLEQLIQDSIQHQMVADVPLGAFLSGGIDSSLIVALMQSQSTKPIKTFTIGFAESVYNEAGYAKEVAKHLGTDHTELYVTPEDVMAVIPKLPILYDEPFSDPSQIPTFLVSKLTREQVTVSLSGDGGDELYFGYDWYFRVKNIWNTAGKIPLSLRKTIGSGLTSLSAEKWDHLISNFSKILPNSLTNLRNPGDKLHKLADLLRLDSPEAMYCQLLWHWPFPNSLVLDTTDSPSLLTNSQQWPNLPDFMHRMMFFDMISYLPDQILTKVDRAAMAVSLETRIPLLDHRIVEFSWKIPFSMKFKNNQGKWLLRQILHKYVPRELIERPKMGFGAPIDFWLRGPLREWAEELLDEKRLKNEGFFDSSLIREKWKEHINGTRNWRFYLWDVLMFQAWKENEHK